MTRDEILEMFRQQSDGAAQELLERNAVILELAQLLADSRGRLSKENFDTLIRIGGVLYGEGRDRFNARSDVAEIMKTSAENIKRERS